MTKTKEEHHWPVSIITAKTHPLHPGSPHLPLSLLTLRTCSLLFPLHLSWGLSVPLILITSFQSSGFYAHLHSEFISWFLNSQHEQFLSQAPGLLCLPTGNPISTFKSTTNTARLRGMRRNLCSHSSACS